jgi:L-lysine 6-transaminase
MGNYLIKRLNELRNQNIINIRGRGLMVAFDLPTKKSRNDFVIECLKNGLVLLGTGQRGIRLIPPYIVSKEEIDTAVRIMERSSSTINKPKFMHRGNICNYLSCGEDTS